MRPLDVLHQNAQPHHAAPLEAPKPLIYHGSALTFTCEWCKTVPPGALERVTQVVHRKPPLANTLETDMIITALLLAAWPPALVAIYRGIAR